MSERRKTRLFVEDRLGPGTTIALGELRAHYLADVLRLKAGAPIYVFNGRDGEWRTRIVTLERRMATLVVEALAVPQTSEPNLWLLFAPIKRQRIDFVAEKASELGCAVIWPVFTHHTAMTRVNIERLRANAIEAAEQCERLAVSEVREAAPLAAALASWPSERRLIVCDETAGAPPALATLARVREEQRATRSWAVLIGPEGGFSDAELDSLRKLPFVTTIGLGPRVLRADTAAVAALAIWQAVFGDWRAPADRGRI